MSVVIRLTKTGRKGEGRYRVVVKEKRSRRDGRPIETLGHFTKSEKGQNKDINTQRAKYWMSQGAIPSPTVKKLLDLYPVGLNRYCRL